MKQLLGENYLHHVGATPQEFQVDFNLSFNIVATIKIHIQYNPYLGHPNVFNPKPYSRQILMHSIYNISYIITYNIFYNLTV